MINKLTKNRLPLDNHKNIELAQKDTKDDIDMIIGYCNASTLDGYVMSGNAIDRPPFAKDENGNIEYKGSHSNMSQGLFTIIGDSNVVDNMTSFNTASREVMKTAQVIPATTFGQLQSAFQSIRFVFHWFKSICDRFKVPCQPV